MPRTRSERAFRRQRPLKGGRTYRVGGFDPGVDKWLEAMMQKFNCSMSMVLNNVVSFVGDVELYDPIKEFAAPAKKERRRKVQR